jgi:hypothetical protein
MDIWKYSDRTDKVLWSILVFCFLAMIVGFSIIIWLGLS